MKIHFKFIKLLILVTGVLFLVGCNPDKPKKDDNKTVTSSQNEETNNESHTQNIATSYFNKIETVNVYAERKLEIEIKPPFENFNISWNEMPKHYRGTTGTFLTEIIYPQNIIRYIPAIGYIGEDSFSLKIIDKDSEIEYIKKFIINVNKSPLEGNRDFSIVAMCDNTSFGEANIMNINIVDDEENLLEKVKENLNSLYTAVKLPNRTRIQLDYIDSSYTDDVFNFHNAFKDNLDKNILIECKYTSNSTNLLFPINRKEWDATIEGFSSGGEVFVRNNIFFYISSLSELHNKIYLKEYEKNQDAFSSFLNTNTFMKKVFPDSHYTAELNYNSEHYHTLTEKFDKDNYPYYEKLRYLANEHTEGSIPILLRKIVENYESYYLSDKQECLDNVVCGTFFPEYTESLTINSNFSDALNEWTKNNNVDEIYSTGKIEYIASKKYVEVDFSANVPNELGVSIASLDLYQVNKVTSSLENYFFFFDLADVYGGAGGATYLSGVYNSGMVGTYICFQDRNKNNLGCLSWSDYLNKKEYIPTFTNEGVKFLNLLYTTDTFYNTELRNVFRRISNHSDEQRFTYTGNLAEILKKYLPKVYEKREEIDSVEYGVFASEFRNGTDYCYNCEGKVKAYEVKLLRVK